MVPDVLASLREHLPENYPPVAWSVEDTQTTSTEHLESCPRAGTTHWQGDPWCTRCQKRYLALVGCRPRWRGALEAHRALQSASTPPETSPGNLYTRTSALEALRWRIRSDPQNHWIALERHLERQLEEFLASTGPLRGGDTDRPGARALLHVRLHQSSTYHDDLHLQARSLARSARGDDENSPRWVLALVDMDFALAYQKSWPGNVWLLTETDLDTDQLEILTGLYQLDGRETPAHQEDHLRDVLECMRLLQDTPATDS